jgi:hypothetical protein
MILISTHTKKLSPTQGDGVHFEKSSRLLLPCMEVSLGAGDEVAVPFLTIADELRQGRHQAEVGVDGLKVRGRGGGEIAE